MAADPRKKAVFALFLVIALGIFLPPNINGNRFSKRLASALSAGLERQVKIGSVKFRLLPRPGFDLYNFEVLDDPSFSAEPLLMCGKVTADLRLTSLWQGRLEIANLQLLNAADQAPPSLNLVYSNGHWNLESLLMRAEQVPTAPTAKKSAEQRSRFPYIAADAGRINIKVGPEKKPYALTNTDFALWLASEDQWHVRLEGRPVRTDMNLSDTGVVRLEGDLKRSSGLRQSPVKLQLSWEQAQLGQLTSLVAGQDKGWRGGLDVNVQLVGSLDDLHIAANAGLEGLRRYDIDRGTMLSLNARCQGQYNGLLDFDCNLPVSKGALRLAGKIAPGAHRNYDLSLHADRLPLSAVATFARHSRRSLPQDLDATGTLDAAFLFHSNESGTESRGNGATSDFEVHSAAISAPIAVSAIHFSLGAPEAVAATPVSNRHKANAATKRIAPPPPEGLVVEPFAIQLEKPDSAQSHGSFTRTGYSLATKGTAPLQRVLDLGKVAGFAPHLAITRGVADFDVTLSGDWANFTPAKLGGTVRVSNVEAVIPGVKDHLLLASADAQFTDAGTTLTRIAAQFQNSDVVLNGAISKPLICQTPPCALQFDLGADRLSTEDLAAVLGADQGKWNLPFLSNTSKLPDFAASGTLRFDTLKLGRMAFQKFSAHVEVEKNSLTVNQISARLAEGSAEGSWHIDWSASPLRYSGSGTLTGVSPDRLEMPVLASWISGKGNLKYTLTFAGNDGSQMLGSASGQLEFAVNNGVSQALVLDSSRPTRFQGLQGSAELNHAVLNLVASKFKAENRIYSMSGSVSLDDRQAKLTVSDGPNHWEITGALDKPNVAAPKLRAQEASAHNQ